MVEVKKASWRVGSRQVQFYYWEISLVNRRWRVKDFATYRESHLKNYLEVWLSKTSEYSRFWTPSLPGPPSISSKCNWIIRPGLFSELELPPRLWFLKSNLFQFLHLLSLQVSVQQGVSNILVYGLQQISILSFFRRNHSAFWFFHLFLTHLCHGQPFSPKSHQAIKAIKDRIYTWKEHAVNA